MEGRTRAGLSQQVTRPVHLDPQQAAAERRRALGMSRRTGEVTAEHGGAPAVVHAEKDVCAAVIIGLVEFDDPLHHALDAR